MTDEPIAVLETAEVVAPVTVQIETRRPPNRFVQMWKTIGGGSLTLSIAIHAGLLLLAGTIILVQQMEDKQVDFLPGGGTQQGAEASSELAERVQIKKQQKLNKKSPMARVVSTSIDAEMTLPDVPLDMISLPDMGSLGGGKLGSGGFGSGGTGGGFGNGHGTGGMSGMTFKPIMMFGMEMKNVRKIAVVMDVSRSMTRYLPIVVKELDRVAKGSNVVLYFGCGVTTPKGKTKLDDKPIETSDDNFDAYWQIWQGKTPLKTPIADVKAMKYDPAKPMPLEDIYKLMKERPNTWYIDFNGITYAQGALMSNEVKEADAIYWFADFQDRADANMMADVVKRMKARKQKLYIHATIKGRNFDIIKEGLVVPTGGEVVDVELPKK
jgi:hypothetical protein